MRFPRKPNTPSGDNPAANAPDHRDDAPRSSDAERGDASPWFAPPPVPDAPYPPERGASSRPAAPQLPPTPDDPTTALDLPPARYDFGLEEPFPPGYGDSPSRRTGGRREPEPPAPDFSSRTSYARPPASRDRPEYDGHTNPNEQTERGARTERGAYDDRSTRETPPREPSRRPDTFGESPSRRADAPRNPYGRDPRDPRNSGDPRASHDSRLSRPGDAWGGFDDARDRRDAPRPDNPYAAPRDPRDPRNGGQQRPSDSIYDRFGWRLPGEVEEEQPRPARPASSSYWEEREERIRLEESGQIPRITPNGPYNPYVSGVFDTSPGAAPATPNDAPFSPYSQQFAMPPLGAEAPPASIGAFGTDPRYEGDAFAQLPPSATTTSSGRFLTQRTASGAFAAGSATGILPTEMRAGATASVPADAPAPSLITDRAVLLFFALTLLLIGGMVAFIALRFTTFPEVIALHFGPAGSGQPDRTGERQELWTIPFLAAIVFMANTALAFVFNFFDRHDRFVPRLLLLGSTIVAAVSWVVLLTLLNRAPLGV